MRRAPVLLLLRAVSLPFAAALIVAAVFSAGCKTMAGNSVPGQCEAGWWARVYSPKRFVIKNPCVTVRGIVLKARYPLDGDAIVILALDPESAHFANEKNDEHYGKDTLELELVCRHPISRFFVSRCWTCRNTITVPRRGDHIEADGFYVLDKNHGHMELHPVTRLTILERGDANKR